MRFCSSVCFYVLVFDFILCSVVMGALWLLRSSSAVLVLFLCPNYLLFIFLLRLIQIERNSVVSFEGTLIQRGQAWPSLALDFVGPCSPSPHLSLLPPLVSSIIPFSSLLVFSLVCCRVWVFVGVEVHHSLCCCVFCDYTFSALCDVCVWGCSCTV